MRRWPARDKGAGKDAPTSPSTPREQSYATKWLSCMSMDNAIYHILYMLSSGFWEPASAVHPRRVLCDSILI